MQETLSEKYFNEVAKISRLTAKQELDAIKHIEDLNTKYWVALLSYIPLFPKFVAALGVSSLPEVERFSLAAKQKTLRSEWSKVAFTLANKLRFEDQEGDLQAKAEAVVRSYKTSSKTFQDYLAKVEKARSLRETARNNFIKTNLKLVIYLASKYKSTKLSMLDLIQEGNIGLFKALSKFDPSKGYRFNTYASWWIRHYINRALSDKGLLVRVPTESTRLNILVNKVIKEHLLLTGEEPTDEYIMNKTKLSKVQMDHLNEVKPVVSTSNSQKRDDTDLLYLVEDTSAVEAYDLIDFSTNRVEVSKLFASLSPIELQVIRSRFGFDGDEEETLSEIGKRNNLSRERIRQIQVKALEKIRKNLER